MIVLLLIAFGVGAFLWILSRDDGLIYDNVYALGINLSGMTQEEAEKAVHDKAVSMYSNPLTITLQDRTLVISPSDAGADVDAAEIAKAAFEYGREGNMFERARARSQAALKSLDLNVKDYLHMDLDFIRDSIESLGSDIASTLTQPTVSIYGTKPQLDKYILLEEVPEDRYEDEDFDDNDLPEDAIVFNPDEDSFEVEGGMVMTVVAGTPGRSLNTEALYETVLERFNTGSFDPISIEYDETAPDVLNAQELFDKYCVLPVDSVLDQEEYVASMEVLGYGFEPGEVQSKINAMEEGDTLKIPFRLLMPSVTKAALERDLFKDELHRELTPHTWNNNRTHNLMLACEALNGYIIKPGAVCSFNEVVGERTAAKGYREAAVYSGMQTKQELGGGVCQVATTLYVCAMYADLEIVERAAHTFAVDYEPLGLDATVYWGYLDFQFRNNTEYPIRIEASVHDGDVDIALIGTDDKDYYIEMRHVMLSSTPWKVVEREITDGSATDGQTLVTPYTGYTAETYRQKWDKETETMISEEYEAYSSYLVRDKEVAVVPRAPTPEPTTPPTTEAQPEPETEPPTTEAPDPEPEPEPETDSED